MRTISYIFALLGVFILGFTISWAVMPRETTVVNSEAFEVCKDALNQFSTLHRVVDEVGVIPYDADFANCYDQSQLLTAKLAEENVKSSIIIKEDRTHAYVAVWLEATTGQFVPIDDDATILEIRDGSAPEEVQCFNTRASDNRDPHGE
jgi:hypothetical protein